MLILILIDASCGSGFFTSGIKISDVRHPEQPSGDYFGVWSSTGAPITTFHWNTNEPNHVISGGRVEHCINMLINRVPLKWFDVVCGTPRCYMCEHAIDI